MIQLALIAIVVLPLWPAYSYFSRVIPGGGPQGGELAVLLLVLYAIGLFTLSLVGGVRLAWTGNGPWLQRYVALPLLPVVGTVIGLWMLAALPEAAMQSADPSTRIMSGVRAGVGMTLLLVSLCAPWQR